MRADRVHNLIALARTAALCREAHSLNCGRYGSERIHYVLKKKGEHISRKRVIRLMNLDGLRGKSPRSRWVKTTDSKHGFAVAPNLLERDFTPQAPNKTWASDVTHLRTQRGFAYLAVVIDLFSRLVVGWAVSTTNDRHLVLAALNMALHQRMPKSGLIHHSDRGSVYASGDYQNALKENALVGSMSRKGDCYDNAVVESFFGTFKTELGEEFENLSALRNECFDYIEVFYNRQRLHSTLGYFSPAEFEENAERMGREASVA